MDAKEFSRLFVKAHGELGGAVLPLTRPNGGEVLVNLSEVQARDGRELHPKVDVRRYLFRERRARALRRAGTVLWSLYDEQLNMSYWGIGALVVGEVARRLNERNPVRFMVCR